jgi:hypothetical protein
MIKLKKKEKEKNNGLLKGEVKKKKNYSNE